LDQGPTFLVLFDSESDVLDAVYNK